MANRLNFLRTLAAAVALTALAGCQTPAVHVTNAVFNFGQELPANMVGRHVAGWVGFDEDWTGRYARMPQNALYTQGVKAGTPEYGYRAVRINLSNTIEGMLWKNTGELSFLTGAYVPDHFPRLAAGDIVEVRQTGTWLTMVDFSRTGEGNVVVRILCRKASPDYDACLERQPRVGEFKGKGETHTPYPPSVAGYGYRFSPMFDAKGAALRAYPGS